MEQLEKVTNMLPEQSSTLPQVSPGAGTSPSQPPLRDVQCPICMRVFSRKFSLEMHFLIHQGIKPYKCQYCGRCFRQKGTLMRHKAIHSQTPSYRCGLCDKSYRQKNVFLHHLRNRHKVSTDVLDRRRCHIKNAENQGLIEAVPPPPIVHPPPVTTERPTNLNAFCLPPLGPESERPPGSAQVPQPSQQSIMLRISDPKSSNAISSTSQALLSTSALYTTAGLPANMQLPGALGLAGANSIFSMENLGFSEKKWQCPFCAFETTSNIEVCHQHLLQHVNETPFDCLLCSQRFYQEKDLNRHLEEVHKHVGQNLSGNSSLLSSVLVDGKLPSRASSLVPMLKMCKEEETSASDHHSEDAKSEVTFTCIPCQIDFCNEDDFECHVKTHVQSVLEAGDSSPEDQEEGGGIKKSSATESPNGLLLSDKTSKMNQVDSKNYEVPVIQSVLSTSSSSIHTSSKPVSQVPILNTAFGSTGELSIIPIASSSPSKNTLSSQSLTIAPTLASRTSLSEPVFINTDLKEIRPYTGGIHTDPRSDINNLKSSVSLNGISKNTVLDLRREPTDVTKHNNSTKYSSENSVTVRKLMCVECGKMFTSKSMYRYHLQMHLAPRAFRCPLCRTCFQRKHQLLQHTRAIHLKKFRCRMCSKQFSYKSLYDQHVKSCTGMTKDKNGRDSLCLPVVDIRAASSVLGKSLIGVIPVVPSQDKENSLQLKNINRVLGVPIISSDAVLNCHLNGLLHVYGKISLSQTL